MAFAGVHHIALSTNDMKAQIEFFTQVVGMKLLGLFPMHGVEGASHCFLQAGETCFLSFIQMEGPDIRPVMGVSHAPDASAPVAGGAMQHLSFNVDTFEELMNLRDRLRSHGYAVVGPMDHSISESMYLGAPEGILLEFSTSDACEYLTPEKWVDPATARGVGISAEDLQRYTAPAPFVGSGGTVPQPPPGMSIYPTPIPRPMFDAVGHLNDTELRRALRYTPPVHA